MREYENRNQHQMEHKAFLKEPRSGEGVQAADKKAAGWEKAADCPQFDHL